MKLLVRLVLLAGAAAALSLIVRDSLARRAMTAAAPIAQVFAEAARATTPPSNPSRPLRPSPPSAHQVAAAAPTTLPETPLGTVPRAARKSAPAASGSATSPPHAITRKELEDAISTRLSGATAVLARDDEGRPIGLRLGGVSRLAPFGVKDGDILVSANGLPLRTGDEALAALGTLKDATHVVVVLRRGATSYSVPVALTD